jgi:hypothetical protein
MDQLFVSPTTWIYLCASLIAATNYLLWKSSWSRVFWKCDALCEVASLLIVVLLWRTLISSMINITIDCCIALKNPYIQYNQHHCIVLISQVTLCVQDCYRNEWHWRRLQVTMAWIWVVASFPCRSPNAQWCDDDICKPLKKILLVQMAKIFLRSD